jgi:deoxyribose-phosphate aldolase
MSGISIAKSLELHLLRPMITRAEVRAGCEHAAAAHLAAVCVWPSHISLAAEVLAGTDTLVRGAIGFPFGNDAGSVKLAACDRAIADGATELAIVLDHSPFAEGGTARDALAELDLVLAHAGWSTLRGTRGSGELTIVVETTMVDHDALVPVFERMHDTSAGFLQTGTGHQAMAVSDQDIRSLRERLPADIALVAVGGVASLEDAHDLLVAGAVRVGTGSAIAIIDQERRSRTPTA